MLPSRDYMLNSMVGRSQEKFILPGCFVCFALTVVFSIVFKVYLPRSINKIFSLRKMEKSVELDGFKHGHKVTSNNAEAIQKVQILKCNS